MNLGGTTKNLVLLFWARFFCFKNKKRFFAGCSLERGLEGHIERYLAWHRSQGLEWHKKILKHIIKKENKSAKQN